MSAARTFRRVVVSVASGRAGETGIATAAEIARLFEAELAGLYIEDETVLGVTDLPFAAEVAGAGTARPLVRIEIERAYRSAAGSVRRQVEVAARREKVFFSFRSMRGSLGAILEQSSDVGDIITFFEPESALERACLGTSSLFAAAMRSRGAVLYLPRAGARVGRGILAYLGGRADRPVIDVSLRLATARGLPLVLATDRPGVEWRPVVEEALADIGEPAPAVKERSLDGVGIEDLFSRCRDLDDHMLVVNRKVARAAAPAALRALIRSWRAPMLFVEPEPSVA